MADISLIDPYSAQQESIARQRRMAQALQQQAQAPIEMPQTPGVLISPYAGLAKVLQGVYGGYQEAEADKEYKNLVNEARTNQAADFSSVIRALSAPGREGVAGQDFVPDTPAVMAPKIEKGFGGYGMPQQVGEYEMTPAIAGQPAIARQEPIAPGYISPELIASLKDPLMRQFAMAQAMAKLEPKAPISVAAGGTLIDPRTFKPVFRADPTPQRPVALSPGQELRGPTGNLLATAAAKTEAAPQSKLAQLQAEYDAIAAKDKNDPKLITWGKAIAKEAEDQRLVFDQIKFEYEKGNPGFTLEKIKNPDGSESVMAVNKGSAVARPVVGADGKTLTSAAPEKTPRYSEIEDKGNIVIVDMNLPANERLAKGQIKGPIRGNLKQIATNDAEGRPVTRWVEETTLAKLGDIPQQYTGLLLEMAQAGQLKPGWESDPRVAGVIRDNLINQSGGITPARLADIRVRIAEAAARLGDSGIAFDAKGLTPSLSNLTTLPSGSSAAITPAAAAIAKAPPKINDVVVSGDKKFKFKGGDPNQQSNWVEVK